MKRDLFFSFLFVLAMGVLLFCGGSGSARLDRRLPGSYFLFMSPFSPAL